MPSVASAIAVATDGITDTPPITEPSKGFQGPLPLKHPLIFIS